ncbi:MAG: hypothetical protein GY910_06205 [bacterium]|nr:hypothetical protein [Deltaproteobacteria bacterium]MCP4904554.1 hypothetical protein [bacterium]
MIYAIAAYSITLGALALYLVLLQHRCRQSAQEVARHRGREAADPRAGFNVGASLLPPIWMLGHGMRLPGALLLAPCLAILPLYQREMWLPLLFVSVIPIAAGAALGFVGNRIAVQHTGLEGSGALSAHELPWALAGIVLHVFVLPWTWYFATAAS